MILIVAGTAGSGKTTVGALIAGRLRWRFADADPLHPKANVAKMKAGIPLTDEDRQPWLRAVGEWIDERIAADQQGVITCSALKRSYRDMLLDGRPEATMVFLIVSRQVLEERLLDRPDHFFPKKLLESQLADLELPEPDERVLSVASQGDPGQTAAKVIAALWPYGAPIPEGPGVPGVL